MWAAEEKEIRRKDPPGFVRWSNPNELQATDRITHTAQGPGTSGSRRAVHATSARHPDTSLGAETLSRPGRRHPLFIEESRPAAVVVPGIESHGLTVEEAYDEQATIASHEESTVHIIAQAVDTEEENRLRRELDQLRQMQIRHERDQLRQILDNAPIVTPVIATNRDVEKGDEKVHVNHDDLPRRDDLKCGTRGRRWLVIGVILLIVVAVAVTLVVVLPSEPTPSDPITTAPTSLPTDSPPTDSPPDDTIECSENSDGSLTCPVEDMPVEGFDIVYRCPASAETTDDCYSCVIYDTANGDQCNDCDPCAGSDYYGFDCSNLDLNWDCVTSDCDGNCLNSPTPTDSTPTDPPTDDTMTCSENSDGSSTCRVDDPPEGFEIEFRCPANRDTSTDCDSCVISTDDNADQCTSCTVCSASDLFGMAWDCSNLPGGPWECATMDCDKNCKN
jgi:hypothetical protein